jgi:hypothetical protein
LKDSLGGLIPTVISTWLTDTAKEQIDKETDADQRRVLAIVANDRTVSLSDIAKQMRWKPLRDGTPNKVKAGRYVKELTRAGWLDNDRRVTTKGQKVLSESSNAP